MFQGAHLASVTSEEEQVKAVGLGWVWGRDFGV